MQVITDDLAMEMHSGKRWYIVFQGKVSCAAKKTCLEPGKFNLFMFGASDLNKS